MSDPDRFSLPIKKARPRSARLIEGLSPKLGRRVSCHSRAAFELWLGAEADPGIQTFCERPVALEVDGRERLLELWVRHVDHEALLVVADEDTALPTKWNGIEVRRVGGADLAASRLWIANWEHTCCPSSISHAIASRSSTWRRFVATSENPCRWRASSGSS